MSRMEHDNAVRAKELCDERGCPLRARTPAPKYTTVVEEKVTFRDDSKRNSLDDDQEVVLGVVHIELQEHVELMAVSVERHHHGKAPVRYNNADVEIQEYEIPVQELFPEL